MKTTTIAIVTTGRFHVADLARELAKLGNQVEFHTLAPAWKVRKFLGANVRLKSYFWLLLPLIAANRLTGRFAKWEVAATDSLAALFLRRCDVFIGMSGIALKSAETAKRRFGAKVLLERGSRHIRSQKEILDAIEGNAARVQDWSVSREENGYRIADFISIPSEHVENSFIERGFPKERLVRNPYGVALARFHPTQHRDEEARRTAIIVGNWTYQKGCDLLAKAFDSLPAGYRLLHVGPVGDAPLPEGKAWFLHHDPVPQDQLPSFYAKAAVQVLPSRQDGLAMVLAQGLASGLILVCSDRTGGRDLRRFLRQPERIIEITPEVPSILEGLKRAFGIVASDTLSPSPGDLTDLSWESYGKRYQAALDRLLGSR